MLNQVGRKEVSKKMMIKAASKNDHLALSQLTKISKASWGYSSELLNRWDGDLTITPSYIEKNEVYKLVENDNIIAYYSFYIKSLETVLLDNLFVHPDYHGRGLGRQLVEDCVEMVSYAPNKKIMLESDPYASGFYRHMGFIETRKKLSSIPGRFLPIMEKTLVY